MKFEDFKKEFADFGYVCYREENSKTVLIYDSNNNYFGSLTWHNEKPYYNHKSCKNIQDTIDSIKEYNKTLKHPSFYYDPFIVEQYKAFRVVQEYMEDKGFKYEIEHCYSSTMHVFVLFGAHGEKIFECRIELEKDVNKFCGRVFQSIGPYSWIDYGNFTDIDGCIAKLNAGCSFELLVNSSTMVTSTEKMGKTMDFSNVTKNEIDGGLNIVVTDYKNKIKEGLKIALSQLGEN